MQNNPYAAPTADPNANLQSGAAVQGPRPWTIGGVLSTGFETLKKYPGVLLGGFIMIGLIELAVQALLQGLLIGSVSADESMLMRDPSMIFGAMGIIFPIILLMSMYFAVGQIRVVLAALRGEQPHFGLYFSGQDRLLPALLLAIVLYIGITIGMFLLIVPGVIVALGWSMSLFYLIDADRGVFESLGESWSAMSGHKGHLFGFGVVLFVAVFGFAIVLGLFSVIPVVGPIFSLLGYLGLMAVSPALFLAVAEIYRSVSGRIQGA